MKWEKTDAHWDPYERGIKGKSRAENRVRKMASSAVLLEEIAKEYCSARSPVRYNQAVVRDDLRNHDATDALLVDARQELDVFGVILPPILFGKRIWAERFLSVASLHNVCQQSVDSRCAEEISIVAD